MRGSLYKKLMMDYHPDRVSLRPRVARVGRAKGEGVQYRVSLWRILRNETLVPSAHAWVLIRNGAGKAFPLLAPIHKAVDRAEALLP